jgi:hypothetical protein
MDEIKLENLTGKPLWIRLLSGRTIELLPAISPVAVTAREVKVNPSIRKMLERGAIRKAEKVEKKSKVKKQLVAEKEATKPEKSVTKPAQGESTVKGKK